MGLLLLAILSPAISLIGGPITIAVLAPILATVAVFAGIYFSLMSIFIWDQEARDCFIGGIALGLGLALIALPFPDGIGRILSAILLAGSQANKAGSSAATCM